MNIKNIIENSEKKPVGIVKKYAVFIPIIEINGKDHILYEIRSKSLRSQPGDICFPGGKIENGETPIDAGVREACEELLLSKDKFEIYGQDDYLITSYGAIIYTIVGRIKYDYSKINPNPREVEKLLALSIDFFLDKEPDIYKIEFEIKRNDDFPYYLIKNGENYKFKQAFDQVMFYRYKENVIWGFTAKMTKNFIDKLKQDIVV